MVLSLSVLVAFAAFAQLSECQNVPLRGPPMFDRNPMYSDSYIPAGMQIIAYLTELMKYELTPTTGGPTTSKPSTTTFRPTPSHLPGLYAPNEPPGPSIYFSKKNTYEEYVQWLNSPGGRPYPGFRRSPPAVEMQLEAIRTILKVLDPNIQDSSSLEDLELIGNGPSSLHKLVNGLDEEDSNDDDDDVKVLKFAARYDDSNVKQLILRQKKVPPTRAYVTMLSLYDLLNKESKKLMLNKYSGFSHDILRELSETSSGTSANQLKYVLSKIVEKRNTNDQTLLKKLETVGQDLEEDNSYINSALRYIPALPFEP